jgi:PPOX class probable F420-dependent enzyme
MSPIPEAIRGLFEAANFVHLSTLRRDGAPRNWIVWVGLEGEQILVCTSERQAKATDMRRDPRVGLSVADGDNPYRMAVVQGRVVETRPDHDCVYMDPIAVKYTSAPFPSRGPHRISLSSRSSTPGSERLRSHTGRAKGAPPRAAAQAPLRSCSAAPPTVVVSSSGSTGRTRKETIG